MNGCTHEWEVTREYVDERGIKHVWRNCTKCKAVTEIVSAVDIHEWQPVNGADGR